MNTMWKVGDLARQTGLTIRTLRYYDQIGLFSPSGMTDSGHRLYSESDLARLQQIISLKELGLSLDEVKSALTEGLIGTLEIVRLQMERLKEQIRLQQKLLEQLGYISKLMQVEERVKVETLTRLLNAMNTTFEKPVWDRQMSRERQLDRLGKLLAGEKRNVDV